MSKKGAIFVVINKAMKITLKERMATFLDQRSHNWQQRLCLITFLMLSLSVVLPGVPMHIVGLIGRCDTPLHIISALLWVATIVVLVLYLLHLHATEDCYIHIRHIGATDRKCPYCIYYGGASCGV